MKWILKDKEGFQEAQNDLGHHILTTEQKYMISTVYNHNIPVIAVGDYTCFDSGFQSTHKVYDGRTKRKEYKFYKSESNPFPLFHFTIDNPPGEITYDAFTSIADSFRPYMKCNNIFVNGEEDLLALAYILLGDNGSIVLWGNPFKKCTDYVIIEPFVKIKVLEMMNKYGGWE